MTPLATLSAVVRAFFALWALALCLADILNALHAVGAKRYALSLPAIALSVPAYVMWEVLFDLALAERLGVSAITVTLCNVAWGWWLAAFVAVTAASLALLVYNVRYARNYITHGSIKLFLDQTPCGVCCWRDNGRVLFANICMNRLCVALTDSPLLNGCQFAQAVQAGIVTVEGRMWRFTCRDTQLGGEVLHEMIAADITTEYAKTQALERDKAELHRLNRELEAYTLGLDDAVRHQEILQAKVNIHDEMNRLMLSTMAAESEDATTLDGIFALWEQNALLLCMEAENSEDKRALARLQNLAAALKIHLVWQDDLPATLDEEQRDLFFAAAQESIANAVKHAHATTMTIAFETTDALCCHFTSDGTMPNGPVPFRGGLANLARLAAAAGAEVTVHADTAFTLTLCFGKKPPKDG